MSNQGDIYLDIIYQQDPDADTDDDAQRLSAAQHKTHQLLQAWRSRFSDPSIAETYNVNPDVQLVVRSASDDQVQVEHISDRGKIMYDYVSTRPDKTVHISTEPAAHTETALEVPEDPALQLEALSQLLFDCDRTEKRKHAA